MVNERKIDPVLVSVLDSRLDSIPEEMARTLERTSRSPVFSEAKDFVTAIFTRDLRLIAQRDYIPILAGAVPLAVENIAKAYESDINEGDIFIHNDTYGGNTHPPDVNIVKPVFFNGELVFWSVTKGHQADMGATGGSIGYDPYSTTIWDDGIVIPACKLYDTGKLNRAVQDLILKNIKLPEIVWGDLMCQVGGVTIGERRLLELVKQYGVETLYAAIDEIIAATERDVRNRIRQIPDGVYYGERLLDYDPIGPRDKPVSIRVKVIKQGDEITVDLSDSDPQTIGFQNSSWANTYSACHVALFYALPGGTVRRNEGALRPIKVIATEGTVVNPKFPAPVSLCTISTGSVIYEAIWLALSNAMPQWIAAGHSGFIGGGFPGFNPRTGRRYAFLDFICSRSCPSGGTEGYDGWNQGGFTAELGVGQFPDIEIYELVFPIHILQHEQEIDSAGAGKFRSGMGHVYKVKFLEDCEQGIILGWNLSDATVPPGLFGGKKPRPNKLILHRADGEVTELDANILITIKKGDILEHVFMSAPGFGDPFERNPEKMREDVRNELVSIQKAKEEYGVVINPVTLEIDVEATEKLRKQHKKKVRL
jgi:N-methylhydantoinase B